MNIPAFSFYLAGQELYLTLSDHDLLILFFAAGAAAFVAGAASVVAPAAVVAVLVAHVKFLQVSVQL
jgi:hypothetical protein